MINHNDDGKMTESTFADEIAEGHELEEILAADDVEESDDEDIFDELATHEEPENKDLERVSKIADEVIGETIVAAKNMIVKEVLRKIDPSLVSESSTRIPIKGTPGRPSKVPPKVQVQKKDKPSKSKTGRGTVKKSKATKKVVKKVVKKVAKKVKKKARR